MSGVPQKKHESVQQGSFEKQSAGARIREWLTTVDHKKVGIMYLVSALFFMAMGGIEALLIRLQLFTPMNDFISAEAYNQIMTMHGTTMIFLVAMPLLTGFINCIMPLQIGARDVAFPALNSFSFWTFFFGGILVNVSWLAGAAPNAGWFAYAPLTLLEFNPSPGIDFYNLGLQLAGIGTLASGINFITTIVNMRTPGLKLLRMPMFTWSTLVISGIILFAFPPLTINFFYLMFDRFFGTSFFGTEAGGNFFIWQHLFWIFGHPEVYILILPAFGIISEVISTFANKRLFGYHSMVLAMVLIGFIGFMVWVHHMFTAGFGDVVNSIFAVSTMLIAIPTGIKIFNWLFTLWGGHIHFNTAMLWAVGLIPNFVMGGVTGVMLAMVPADYQYHDTYFVVAHFHYVIIGGTLFGIMAGFYYWFPKIFGRFLNERLGKWNFWLTMIGFHLTFFFQHIVGLLGMPRRVYTYKPDMGFDTINAVSTIGAFVMAIGMFLFVINFVVSLRSGKVAGADPWDGRTLEWTISSPAPHYNFAQLPLVRSLDVFWNEKRAGNRQLPPAEPLGPIHMPSNTILPFLLSLALFAAATGAVFRSEFVVLIGLTFTAIFLFMSLMEDDHGYHIDPSEIHGGTKGEGA